MTFYVGTVLTNILYCTAWQLDVLSSNLIRTSCQYILSIIAVHCVLPFFSSLLVLFFFRWRPMRRFVGIWTKNSSFLAADPCQVRHECEQALPFCSLITHARVPPIQIMFVNDSCEGPVYASFNLFETLLDFYLRVLCDSRQCVIYGGW